MVELSARLSNSLTAKIQTKQCDCALTKLLSKLEFKTATFFGSRLATLIQDVNGMRELADWNRRITFQAKPENAPIQYIVKLDYPGFARLQAEKPVETTRPHEVEIRLPTDYPRVAPIVYWRTEVFHPARF